MIIHAIADTHFSHEEVKLPGGDILIVAGDFLGNGAIHEVAIFNKWLTDQRYKHRIVIAGNHDWCCESPEVVRRVLWAAHYLHHEAITIEGINIFGSPWTPEFNRWAFMYPRASERARQLWGAIPEDTEILITHGPAADTRLGLNNEGIDTGCEVLRNRITELPKLQAHICGHIHEGHGSSVMLGGAISYNVTVMDASYIIVHSPAVIPWR